MNENKITAYNSEDEIERNNVRIERSNRRKRKKRLKFFKLFFTALFIGLIVYGGYKLYPHLQIILNSQPNNNESNNENIDTPPTQNQNGNQSNGNNSEANPPTNEPHIPLGSYPIIENSSAYFLNNEAQLDFEASQEFSPIKSNEIYSKYGSDAPLVLITHFSSREAYSDGESYSTKDNFYSDTNNVSDIGKLFCDKLNKLGINTIHLNEVYASGSIYNSRVEYEKSLETALMQFPSITYVINISRDVNINKDMSMIKSVVNHNEAKLAQLSFISGSSLNIMTENQIKNANFALSLSSFVNSSVESLIKQNTISQFALAQDYSPFCLEIEFGSYANSYDEVATSASYFADLFCHYLTS